MDGQESVFSAFDVEPPRPTFTAYKNRVWPGTCGWCRKKKQFDTGYFGTDGTSWQICEPCWRTWGSPKTNDHFEYVETTI